MQYKINTDPKKMIGKRPNLAEEKSVTDNIVSALSVPPEDMPLPPLSPLPAHTPASQTAPLPPRKKNPKALSIVGTVFVYLPILFAVVYFIHGALTGQPLPVLMFPMLMLIARFASYIGGLILYFAARAAQYLKKSIGFTTLAAVLLPIVSSFILAKPLTSVNPASAGVNPVAGWIALIFIAISLLCMLALCVFGVLMLIRAFSKRAQSAAPDGEHDSY